MNLLLFTLLILDTSPQLVTRNFPQTSWAWDKAGAFHPRHTNSRWTKHWLLWHVKTWLAMFVPTITETPTEGWSGFESRIPWVQQSHLPEEADGAGQDKVVSRACCHSWVASAAPSDASCQSGNHSWRWWQPGQPWECRSSQTLDKNRMELNKNANN